jgi:hypothetical protein
MKHRRIKQFFLIFGAAMAMISCQSVSQASNTFNDQEIMAATGFDINVPLECVVVEASWMDESGYQVAVGDRIFKDAASMQPMTMSIKDFMRDKPYGLKGVGVAMGARIWFYAQFRPVLQAPGDLRLETSGFNTAEGGPGSLVVSAIPGAPSILIRTAVTPEAAPPMFYTMDCGAAGFFRMMRNAQ